MTTRGLFGKPRTTQVALAVKSTMPAGMITAWSFSRLNDYRKCPRFAYYKHVMKMKEPGNDAMARGTMIDQLATDYINGAIKKCPPEVAHFKAEFDQLRKYGNAITQEQWAFTADWEETGWFDKDAWLRVKTDVYRVDHKSATMLLVDNKTGKEREEHNEQVELYGLCGLLKMPELKAVDARIWYLDSGTEKPEQEKVYTPADIPRLKKYWLAQVKPMLNDKRFEEKPSSACNWCHFSKKKGGPCKF